MKIYQNEEKISKSHENHLLELKLEHEHIPAKKFLQVHQDVKQSKWDQNLKESDQNIGQILKSSIVRIGKLDLQR